jgi:hypothetical protein
MPPAAKAATLQAKRRQTDEYVLVLGARLIDWQQKLTVSMMTP